MTQDMAELIVKFYDRFPSFGTGQIYDLLMFKPTARRGAYETRLDEAIFESRRLFESEHLVFLLGYSGGSFDLPFTHITNPKEK